MLLKNISGIIGGIIIATSIIIGAYILTDHSTIAASGAENPSEVKNIFTIDDLTEYLSVSTEDIEKMIDEDDTEKASIQGEEFDTYQYIPHMTISDKELFLKSEIDKWVKYRILNDR